MAQAKKQSAVQPQRARHVPRRTCVACRRGDAKGGLVRVVRDGEGRVRVDLGGKLNGRGAYLCRSSRCWEQALQRRGLERALKIEQIAPEDRAALLLFGRSLGSDPAAESQEAS